MASCLVSAMEANKLLQGGFEAYLAWVQDTQIAPKRQLQAPRIVREDMDVFSNELPRTPPPREVGSSIELIPGTTPISVPPYRMARLNLGSYRSSSRNYSKKGSLGLVFPRGEHLHYMLRRRTELYDFALTTDS